MKLRSYQLCRWCDSLWHGRRKWLTLGAGAALLLLSLLLGLHWLTLPLLLLAAGVLALYLTHLSHAFGASYQRQPRPGDALCETVLIDAELIGQGTRLRAAAQPIDVAENLTMRLGSGTLLLGAAVTLTADGLDPADRAALLSAVQGLNIKPDRMRSQYPVLRREMEGAVVRLTVRDGVQKRRYYCGSPAEVAELCASIWEGQSRPLTPDDHLRIDDTARYIAQGQCRVLAYATALEGEAPVFLGLCGLGEEIDLVAAQDVAALRAMGLTVMLEPTSPAEEDLTSLLTLLELPDYHARADVHLTRRNLPSANALCVTRRPGDSLQEPVHTLRARFRLMEDLLRRFAYLTALPMALSILLGAWPASLCAGAMLAFAALFLGIDQDAPLPQPRTMLILLIAGLLAKAILLTQPVSLARMAGGIIVVCTAFGCGVRLCGNLFRWKGLPLVLPSAAIVYVLAAALLGLSSGVTMLLPMGFAALISAAMCLLLLFEDRVFK